MSAIILPHFYDCVIFCHKFNAICKSSVAGQFFPFSFLKMNDVIRRNPLSPAFPTLLSRSQHVPEVWVPSLHTHTMPFCGTDWVPYSLTEF